MIIDQIQAKLGELYVAGNIPTKDRCGLADMLEGLRREFIRCQYRLDERLLEIWEEVV
jgi:hypothetical protein